jgi:hypothetical protein
MNEKVMSFIVFFGLTLITLLMLSGCINQGSQGMYLIIENQTDEILIIYYQNDLIGNVNPNETIQQKTLLENGKYPITAKNMNGDIVFSKEFTFKNLQKIDNGVYKAVIPPLTKASEYSGNVTGE